VSGLVLALVFALPAPASLRVDASTFSFGVAGDFGWTTSRSKITLQALARDQANLSFFIADGDLSYNFTAGTEGAWCDYVKSFIGTTFPFQVVAGNQEDDDPVRIDNFAACLPDRLGSTGVYGKEYYNDFPSGTPLARMIHISPDLIFPPIGKWTYVSNNTHYRWLISAIDGARAAGIRWVIVMAHKPCLGLVGTTCSAGQDLQDLLLIKKVDLVIFAHEHSYQRTKQLSCAIRNMFLPECVVDADGAFAKGAGTVIATVGTGGQGFSSVGLTTDVERGYFAAGMGSNTPGFGWGYLRVTISETGLMAKTVFSGTWQDAFSIGA
jgi:hypothetical protein